MLYHTPYPKTDSLTVNTNWNITAPKQPVRQLLYVVDLDNFMTAQ